MELLIARNPDPESSLPYLIRLPVGAGLVFATKGLWPETAALYCHPLRLDEWPTEPDLVEQIALRSCVRRGAAIDVIADRTRQHRSQIVYTTARGRDMVFWQSPKTRKQARPNVRTPTARAGGLAGDLQIIVDAHERYPYRFTGQQVETVRRALRAGDYAVEVDGRVWASVERKSLGDLVSSLTSGRLRFAVAELAALPRAAVVVEDRYSAIFSQEWIRPAVVLDGLAELQVRNPSVPIVFCETRKLAEEWTYRYLSAAYLWAEEPQVDEAPVEAAGDVEADDSEAHEKSGRGSEQGAEGTERAPTPAQVRAWAMTQGLPVSDRGRLRPAIWEAWHEAHPEGLRRA